LSPQDWGSGVEPSKEKVAVVVQSKSNLGSNRHKPIEPKPRLAPRDLPMVFEKPRAEDAAKVLTELINVPKSMIPKELVEDAKAVAVLLSVKKAAFVFGSRWSKGLHTTRDENGR